MESVFGPLDQVLRFLGTHVDLWVYGILFVAAATEMLFPPFPGDMVFLSGMVLAGGGALSWPVAFAASLAGGLAGAWALYELGYWKGRRWFSHADHRVFNPRVLNRIDGLFTRYGFQLIVVSRFLPGIRSVVPVAAGVASLSRLTTASYLALSILIWNALLAGIGLLFGRNWEAVTTFVAIYNRLVVGILIVLATTCVVWLYKKTKSGATKKMNA